MDNGKLALEVCPKCGKENYILNVLTGVCTWCRFDANATKAEEPGKRQTATEQVCGSEAERRTDEKHSDPTAGISESPKQE